MTDVQSQLEESLAQLDATVSEAASYFRRQPDESSTGAWGAKEVLSHVLYWHDFTCQSVEGVAAGREPQPPKGQTDEINANAVSDFADTTIVELADRLVSSQQRLGRAVRSLPDPGTIVMRRPDGTEFTAPKRLEVMSRHIRSHIKELGG